MRQRRAIDDEACPESDWNPGISIYAQATRPRSAKTATSASSTQISASGRRAARLWEAGGKALDLTIVTANASRKDNIEGCAAGLSGRKG